MSQSSPVFRWSKSVEESELDWWETEFTVAGVSFVSEKTINRKRCKLMVYDPDRSFCERLREKYGGGVAEVREEDWSPAATDGSTGLIRIRDRFLVTESDDESVLDSLRSENPKREILSFPPQLAFGTGFHPTTAGCLRLLADATQSFYDEDGWKMLDLGSGTGILAIAAAKLGASSITALELDEMALEVAKGNAKRHGIPEKTARFFSEDAVEWVKTPPKTPFQVIAANLFSSLLVEILPHLKDCLAPGGTIILSGFLTSQTREVVETARKSGFEIPSFLRRGKWVAASGQLKIA
ncbi:MAG: methyltransferase domain-containing protein [Verrucomicrobiales bacterium]|nr:methyltransferase domain-containing protein [Verrucomicrobiales bacterium]